MHRRIIAIGAAAVVCLFSTAFAARASSDQPVLIAAASSALQQRIFGRLASPGAPASFVIPFSHRESPLVSVLINGTERRLLFDTGTNTSLLNLTEAWPVPARMEDAADDAALAEQEGKRLSAVSGATLRYASAPLVRIGGVSLRDVPWRLYQHAKEQDADWTGAFAPVLLRHWLIEVNNTRQEILLHDRSTWLPQPGAVMLPLLNLPRGLFVPLGIGAEQLWFHFDTGFAGGIGLTPATLARHADDVALLPGEVDEYAGWHADYSYSKLIVHELTLPGYPQLSWADGGRQMLAEVDGIAYREAYPELAGYGVGGIAGSGLWQRFDYVLDYELGRLYLWPR
jgi:hypothetical protein